jgi:hypothetical protein
MTPAAYRLRQRLLLRRRLHRLVIAGYHVAALCSIGVVIVSVLGWW